MSVRKIIFQASIGIALLVLLLAAGGTAAGAASVRRVDQTVTLGTLRQSAGYPGRESSVVFAGTVRSGLGRGTIVLTVVITAHPSSAVYVFRGTGTAFYPHGTTIGAFTGTAKLESGGRFALAGRGHYTGGTLYHHARRSYSFTGTAPLPPPPPACAVPAGWTVVASDADIVVIVEQSGLTQEYRYCGYAEPSRGFELLVHSDSCGGLALTLMCSKVDGVALSYILYDTWTGFASPSGCGVLSIGSSAVYAVDTTSGKTATLAQGQGGITSAGLSPPGVGAWILTYNQCPSSGGNQRTETLGSYSFRTGAVTTLDTGDPGETTSSPPSLANLQLYQCATGCPADTVVVAWTHDGTWRYAQAN